MKHTFYYRLKTNIETIHDEKTKYRYSETIPPNEFPYARVRLTCQPCLPTLFTRLGWGWSYFYISLIGYFILNNNLILRPTILF